MSTGSPSQAKQEEEESIIVRSYPKVIILYPTVVFAVLFGITQWLQPTLNVGDAQSIRYLCGATFMAIFALNLFVMSFDFPRMAAVSMVLAIFVLFLALMLLNTMIPIWSQIAHVLSLLKVEANSEFYMCFATIFTFVYFAAWVFTRFDYWEITANELLHHHGPWGDLERYPSPNLKIDKELHDVFEYLILRSGKLTLYPATERKAIILENVPGINGVEERIKSLLSATEVRIETDHVKM
jgi:hypothetical protein